MHMRIASIFQFLRRDRRSLFMGLGALTVVLRVLAGCFPTATEQIYSRGLFLGVRTVIDFSWGMSPIPFSYIVILGLLGYWGWKIWRNRKQARKPFKQRLRLALLNIGGFAGALVFFFHFFWGFNYARIPIEEKLGLQLDSLSVEQLCFEAEWAARQAEKARAAIPGISNDSIDASLLPQDMEQEVRRSVQKCMALMEYPFAGRVRGRIIKPGGWMLSVGISGIYNPFTGEGNVSGAQTPQKYPFTMAHEMAHACGFGDEGTCNFIGMVACECSENPFIQYSGRMGYFQHVGNDIAELDPLLYRMLIQQLDPGIRADMRANYNNYMRYAGRISKIGQSVNNAYLNVQGVKGGINSYDRVVVMRAAWRKRTGQ
jgi:hypothetical protein